MVEAETEKKMAILEDDEEEDEGETDEAHVKKKKSKKETSRVFFFVKFRDAVEYVFEMMQLIGNKTCLNLQSCIGNFLNDPYLFSNEKHKTWEIRRATTQQSYCYFG